MARIPEAPASSNKGSVNLTWVAPLLIPLSPGDAWCRHEPMSSLISGSRRATPQTMEVGAKPVGPGFLPDVAGPSGDSAAAGGLEQVPGQAVDLARGLVPLGMAFFKTRGAR